MRKERDGASDDSGTFRKGAHNRRDDGALYLISFGDVGACTLVEGDEESKVAHEEAKGAEEIAVVL
jgi:hypothetical protein